MSAALDTARGTDALGVAPQTALNEYFRYQTRWGVRKFASDADVAADRPYAEATIAGNVLLNEGINALLTLMAGGAETAYSNANARLGVGDSSTAESAAHTGLQAGSNFLYKAMDGGYPTYGTSQQVVFRASFTGAEANYAWNEFSVDNGNTANKNFNRKVSSQGTKTAGQTWQLTLTVTIS